jgi:hypothetical protein
MFSKASGQSYSIHVVVVFGRKVVTCSFLWSSLYLNTENYGISNVEGFEYMCAIRFSLKFMARQIKTG